MSNDRVFSATRNLRRCSLALHEHVLECSYCSFSKDDAIHVQADCTMGLLLLNALNRAHRTLADAKDDARAGECADCE